MPAASLHPTLYNKTLNQRLEEAAEPEEVRIMPLHSRPAVIAGLLWIATGVSAFAQPQMTPQPPAAEPARQQAPADPLAAAPRITGQEARQALAKGEAVLVDVRAKESYDSGHAKGAISLPLNDLSARMGELPKDKLVITYCT